MNSGVTENPALFGASGVTLLALQAAGQAGLIPAPLMSLITAFFEGGTSTVAQALLLAAAGFLPRDFSKILSAEPVLGEVFYLLSDEQLPAEYRENMRQVLHLLAEQARISLQTMMVGRITAAA